MTGKNRVLLVLAGTLAALPLAHGMLRAAPDDAPPQTFESVGFSFEREVVVPTTPDRAFAFFTGDVSGWWDHTFTERPAKLVIEPKVGGGFYELFDEQENGIQHAVITWCEPGRKLVMRGPLGLHGRAADLVTTITFEALGENETRVVASVHGVGEFGETGPRIVAEVWRHFLVEAYGPWVEKQAG
jgi:hypothetical protein